MIDPYLDWLEGEARFDDPAEQADHEQARLDRQDDFIPRFDARRQA